MDTPEIIPEEIERFDLRDSLVGQHSVENLLTECNKFLRRSGLTKERRRELVAFRDALNRGQSDESLQLIRYGILRVIEKVTHSKQPLSPFVDLRVLQKEKPKPGSKQHQAKEYDTVLSEQESLIMQHEQTIYGLRTQLEQAPKTEDVLLTGILNAMTELTQRIKKIEDVIVPVPEEPLPPPGSSVNFRQRFPYLYDQKMKEIQQRERAQRRAAKKAAAEAAKAAAEREAEAKRIPAIIKKARKRKTAKP